MQDFSAAFGRRQALLGGAAVGLIGGGAAQAQAQATPRRGGILRIASPDAPDTLDPQASASGPGFQAGYLVFDNLTALDANDLAIPQLATSWEAVGGDTRNWVFELRQGVKFHHGTEFTSADVVATIERAQDPAGGRPSTGTFGPIASITAEGRYRVRFTMSQPFAELPVLLANEFGRMLPADKLDTLRNAPSGTGPFKFENYQPGASLSFVRNPDYWMPGIPYLDGVRMVIIREAMAQQASLRAGAVDIITRLSPEAMLVLRAVPTIKPFAIATGNYHCVTMQANQPPFDNPKVREAFKFLLDRQPLFTAALFGQGSLGNDIQIPPSSPYLPTLPDHRQDLPRARRLLDESGVGRIDLDIFTTSDRPPAPKIALALSEAASKIGVTLRVRDIPYTEYVANVMRKRPLYTSSLGAAPTLFQMVYRYQHTDSPYNYGREGTPERNALLDRMVAEGDFDRRKALVAEIMTDVQRTGERIVPYFMPYLCATSLKVNAFVPPRYAVIDVRGIWLSA
ncbi:ABC transporter substrate-binding protein [Humitalea sp. 24SJ18S-53]|uniref:ABC transporter substrate-binding protein n=1 Tax=Humitalea sp. 24SJ18S-53 TaxID=3422307 RepID=UPI003D67FF48